MMKKHSIILLFLSVFLCLSMLLTSCTPNTSDNGEETTDQATDTTDTTDIADVTDYRAIVEKWSEYLTFTAPAQTEQTFTEAAWVFSNEDDQNTQVRSFLLGWFYVVESAHLTTDLLLDDTATVEKYSYRVYDTCTGNLVFETEMSYEAVNGFYPTCKISTLKCEGTYLQIFEVKTETYSLEMNELGEEIVVPTVSYSYYDAAGSLLTTQEEALQATWNRGCNITLDIEGNVYTFSSDGKLLHVFEKGTERIIPYDFKTYGDYLYIFGDRNVTVIDKDYKKLCEYNERSVYDSINRYIIDDGSRMVYQYKSYVSTPDSTYDYESFDGAKYNVYQVIIDVSNGAVTEIAENFEIVKMISSLDTESTGIGFKNEHQLAVIRKITDQMLSNERTVAILDKDLNIVAELPSFLVAQKNVVGMLDSERLLVTSSTYTGDQTLYYTVDLNSYTVDLYVNQAHSGYEMVDNGFIHDGKLYNIDCEELLDLGDYNNYVKYDDYLLLEDGAGSYLCYIENGELFNQVIADFNDATVITQNGFVVAGRLDFPNTGAFQFAAIYNSKGTLLFESDEKIVFDDLSAGESCVWFRCKNAAEGSENYYILK